MARNRIISIGYTSGKHCYLNVSRDEAIRRYMASQMTDEPPEERLIEEFEFDDEFQAYEVWGPPND